MKTKEGLVFFNDKKKSDSQGNVKSINFKMDRTSIEVFHNHFHLEDIFSLKSSSDLADIAKTIGEIWATKLKKDFPKRRFRVYMVWEDDISLRFHQVHNGEPFWLNKEDWSEQISKGRIVIWDI